MSRRRSERVLVHRVENGHAPKRLPDELIVEEPLEIRLDGHLVATTMRTPGNDFELAAGLCFTDGLLADAAVTTCRYCEDGRNAMEGNFNIVTVETGGRAPVPQPRLTPTTSSCGLCGSTSIDDLRARLQPLDVEPMPLELLASMPDRVRAGQTLFDRTGGVHAAAAFDLTGTPIVVREDIGRHNAVDKVIGRMLLDGMLPAAELGLWVSGRASFEIVQKAWAGGFAALVAVSAPSNLAVEAARAAGLTLAGFARPQRLNIYAPADL
ncbi:MAG TPA: formate dehydrogenase accessory sulfurtransferase FdhD [Acidimicrobiales bacterium]|jgi:FdhD protein